MNYTVEKDLLIQKVEKLKESLTGSLLESSQLKVLEELGEDLVQDYYTIMVIGEFKHGKSTFVNALLGKDLMPRDVTPTTATINAVFHSEKPALQVLRVDGQIEKKELTSEQLNEYTAAADFNIDEIKYLKLFTDAALLKNKVVLIDTPGVNDINQQRSDITFQFLPRADVIIYMTSMDAAIKQTEKTFIQEFLLKNGHDKIIFAANFMDRIDDEELDDTIDYIERRIQTLLEGERIELFPMSAREALEGKLNGDEKLLRYSGVPEIEAEIVKRIESGTRSIEKLERFQWRLKASAETIINEIETARGLSGQSLEYLQTQVGSITNWLSNRDIWKGQLQTYIIDRENEIKYMVRKSIQHFGSSIQEDIENRIRLYHGADIKNLVESQIPIAVKSHFNVWVNQYSDYIHELLRRTQTEVVKGLSSAFNQSVDIQGVKGSSLHFAESIPILNAQTGNANVKAGLVLGGAGTLAILLGGPFFLPIVGMAGLPLLSQKLAEKQLENIKPELMTAARCQITQLVDNFEGQAHNYVHRTISQIKESSMEEFSRLLVSYETILKNEINSKQKEASTIQIFHDRLGKIDELIKNEFLEGDKVHE